MYARCSRILEREIEALRGIGELQKQVHDAVFKREWAGFEALLAKASGIGTELEALEEERRTLFSELPGFSAAPDFETGFYRLSVCLPPDEQRNLTAKYRELRMAGRRVRINNENLLAYIAGIRATMAAFIESAFPGRKGRLYARNGAVIPQDMSCMVLNHSL